MPQNDTWYINRESKTPQTKDHLQFLLVACERLECVIAFVIVY